MSTRRQDRNDFELVFGRIRSRLIGFMDTVPNIKALLGALRHLLDHILPDLGRTEEGFRIWPMLTQMAANLCALLTEVIAGLPVRNRERPPGSDSRVRLPVARRRSNQTRARPVVAQRLNTRPLDVEHAVAPEAQGPYDCTHEQPSTSTTHHRASPPSQGASSVETHSHPSPGQALSQGCRDLLTPCSDPHPQDMDEERATHGNSHDHYRRDLSTTRQDPRSEEVDESGITLDQPNIIIHHRQDGPDLSITRQNPRSEEVDEAGITLDQPNIIIHHRQDDPDLSITPLSPRSQEANEPGMTLNNTHGQEACELSIEGPRPEPNEGSEGGATLHDSTLQGHRDLSMPCSDSRSSELNGGLNTNNADSQDDRANTPSTISRDTEACVQPWPQTAAVVGSDTGSGDATDTVMAHAEEGRLAGGGELVRPRSLSPPVPGEGSQEADGGQEAEGSVDEPEGDVDDDGVETEDSDVEMGPPPKPISHRYPLIIRALSDILHLISHWTDDRQAFQNVPANAYQARDDVPFIEWAQEITSQTLADARKQSASSLARSEFLRRLLQVQTAAYYQSRKAIIRENDQAGYMKRCKRQATTIHSRGSSDAAIESREKFEITEVVNELTDVEHHPTKEARNRRRDQWKRDLKAGRRWQRLILEQGMAVLLLNPREHLGWRTNSMDRLETTEFDELRREFLDWDDLTDMLDGLNEALPFLLSHRLDPDALNELAAEEREEARAAETERAASFTSTMTRLVELERRCKAAGSGGGDHTSV